MQRVEIFLQLPILELQCFAGWQTIPDDSARSRFGAAPAQRDSQLVRRTRSACAGGNEISTSESEMIGQTILHDQVNSQTARPEVIHRAFVQRVLAINHPQEEFPPPALDSA